MKQWTCETVKYFHDLKLILLGNTMLINYRDIPFRSKKYFGMRVKFLKKNRRKLAIEVFWTVIF